MRYEYAGPGPHEDGELGLIRPGDIRDFGEEPDRGPWRLLDDPDGGAESGSPPSGTQAPAPAPDSPPASGLAAFPAAPAATSEGM